MPANLNCSMCGGAPEEKIHYSFFSTSGGEISGVVYGYGECSHSICHNATYRINGPGWRSWALDSDGHERYVRELERIVTPIPAWPLRAPADWLDINLVLATDMVMRMLNA